MSKSTKTKTLLNKTDSQITYLEWQKQMLEAITADMEEIEQSIDELTTDVESVTNEEE